MECNRSWLVSPTARFRNIADFEKTINNNGQVQNPDPPKPGRISVSSKPGALQSRRSISVFLVDQGGSLGDQVWEGREPEFSRAVARRIRLPRNRFGMRATSCATARIAGRLSAESQ